MRDRCNSEICFLFQPVQPLLRKKIKSDIMSVGFICCGPQSSFRSEQLYFPAQSPQVGKPHRGVEGDFWNRGWKSVEKPLICISWCWCRSARSCTCWSSLAAWVLATSSCQWFSQTTLIYIWLDLNFGFNINKSSLSLLIKGWMYFIHWDYFITESRATTLGLGDRPTHWLVYGGDFLGGVCRVEKSFQ